MKITIDIFFRSIPVKLFMQKQFLNSFQILLWFKLQVDIIISGKKTYSVSVVRENLIL